MTANIGFNPQINQPNQQPVQQSSEQQNSNDAAKAGAERAKENQGSLRQAADVAELSNQAIKRQAESGGVSPTARMDLARLSEMQNNLDTVEQRVRDVANSATAVADGGMSSDQITQAQQRVSDNLNQVNEIGRGLAEEAQKLQTRPAPISGRLEIVVNTEDLGRIEVVPGESISMADIQPEGKASLGTDPKLAARSAQKALEEVSAMRTEVANVASAVSGFNIGGAEGTLMSGQTASQIAQDMVGNAVNNPGALLEAAAGISTGNALSLLSS